MRPQRAAAAAASAAIAVLSENTADPDEDARKAPSHGCQKPRKSADETEFRLGPAKPTTPSILDNSTGPIVPYEPATLCGLPVELKHAILRHFDDCPFTILNLLLVSKVWYATLTMGTVAERNWERRCKTMGSTRKSPGCKTWRETFFYVLHRRCARCFWDTTAKLGQLFDVGYRWLVVCENCQSWPGPFKVVSKYTCLSVYGIPKDRLAQLKHKYRKEDNRDWVTEYLASSVSKLILAIKAEKALRIELVVSSIAESKRNLLRQAINHVEANGKPFCSQMSMLVCSILDEHNDNYARHCEELVNTYTLLQSAIRSLHNAFAKKGFEFDVKAPYLLTTRRKPSRVATWMGGIINKDVTVKKYVGAAVTAKQAEVDAAHAFEEKMKAVQEGLRVANGEDPVQASTTGA